MRSSSSRAGAGLVGSADPRGSSRGPAYREQVQEGRVAARRARLGAARRRRAARRLRRREEQHALVGQRRRRVLARHARREAARRARRGGRHLHLRRGGGGRERGGEHLHPPVGGSGQAAGLGEPARHLHICLAVEARDAASRLLDRQPGRDALLGKPGRWGDGRVGKRRAISQPSERKGRDGWRDGGRAVGGLSPPAGRGTAAARERRRRPCAREPPHTSA